MMLVKNIFKETVQQFDQALKWYCEKQYNEKDF